jgi:hypothetical protein
MEHVGELDACAKHVCVCVCVCERERERERERESWTRVPSMCESRVAKDQMKRREYIE